MKRVIKFQINISNRWLYTLITIGVLILVGVGVYAIAGVSHDASEISEVDPTVNDYVRNKGSCVDITGGSGLCDGVDNVGIVTETDPTITQPNIKDGIVWSEITGTCSSCGTCWAIQVVPCNPECDNWCWEYVQLCTPVGWRSTGRRVLNGQSCP